MTEAEAKDALFGGIDYVYSGYVTREEPVSGRAFWTFAGVAFKEPGETLAEGSIQPTPEEGMRVHVEALGAWLKAELPKFKRPVVCVRKFPEIVHLTSGGWLAVTRLLVTEGGRDVEAKVELMPFSGLGVKILPDEPNLINPVPIRGVVMSGQPVVGVAQ